MACPSNDTYVLQVGEKGKERLTILNELFQSSSCSLLLEAGLSPGKKILEVGCGTGCMTNWMAEKIGPKGQIYAVDISAAQLDIARESAKKQKLENITFIENSIFDLKDLPQFDLIYSKFTLMHLSEPYKALEMMLRFLKPGGYIVCEEASNAITYCYPPSSTFQKSRQLLLSLAEKKKLDFNLGEKLYDYFRKLALENISVNFIQPIFKTPHQKKLILLLVEELKENYKYYDLASEQEIAHLLKSLSDFIEDDSYLVSFARTTQIYAKRPEAIVK
jgi:ubiquinone/menaquinone biosynthesis C-methylase UbiE